MTKSDQSKNDLLKHLYEHIEFLNASCASFDAGFYAEAKRIATTIRVLLHDTAKSKSLLGLLGIKDNLAYVNKSVPFDERNLMSHTGLVGLKISNGKASYFAFLDDVHSFLEIQPSKTFENWWNEVVIKDQNDEIFTRKSLVLHLANKDGGAHVDPKLDASYANLTRSNSVGWLVCVNEEDGKPLMDVELHSMRQIAYEFLQTIKTIDLAKI